MIIMSEMIHDCSTPDIVGPIVLKTRKNNRVGVLTRCCI